MEQQKDDKYNKNALPDTPNHYHKDSQCIQHNKTKGDTYSRPSNANKNLFNKKYKESQEDGKVRHTENSTSILITIILAVFMVINPANRPDSHTQTNTGTT